VVRKARLGGAGGGRSSNRRRPWLRDCSAPVFQPVDRDPRHRWPRSYPPPPWRLVGKPTVLTVATIDAEAARRHVAGDIALYSLRGRTLGGLLAARYGPPSTLAYSELAVVLGRARGGWCVGQLYVDDAASLRGGRELFGVPKELATFTWQPDGVEVERDGQPIVRLEWSSPRLGVPLPALATVVGAARSFRVAGLLRAMPVHVRVHVPDTSPLAPLRLTRPPIALAGDVALRAGAVRRRRWVSRSAG
jgi:acetoacetate decarboxylase